MEKLVPKDKAEEIAIFRSQVLGPVLSKQLCRGELAEELRHISQQHFRPPGSNTTRRFAVPTLERWLYRYRRAGLSGLRPLPRHVGHARALTSQQRELLLDIRRERPRVPVSVLLRTLQADGRLDPGTVGAATVRRLFAAHGLDAVSARNTTGAARLRWEAEAPGILWHADVCHGPALRIDGRAVPLRIHAILDDASRYVVGIAACTTERETDMLALMVKTLRSQPAPKTLYLDNGSTYSGAALVTACARLDIQLLHAKPYDPRARGKMERFWRTLRLGCLDHLGQLASLHDVQVRLLAFIDAHYHKAPHGGLLGKTPAEIYNPTRESRADRLCDTERLTEALTVRAQRRVKGDGTVSVGGIDWESDRGFLAGRKVTIARSFFAPQSAPWIEHEDKRFALRPVDARINGKVRRRSTKRKTGIDAIAFDPAGALLSRLVGKGGDQ